MIYAIYGNVDLCYKSLINSMHILVCLKRLNVANKGKKDLSEVCVSFLCFMMMWHVQIDGFDEFNTA